MWAYGKGARTLSSKDQLKIQAGLAYYHITRPSQQLDFGELDKLYSKWSFHSDAFIGLSNSKIAVLPTLLVLVQGPAKEITLGTLFRYTLQERSKYTGAMKGMAVAFGGYYRIGDAFSPSIELEVANFAVGFSYDFTTSKLRTATNGLGGFEIFLRFQNPNPFTSKRSRSPRFI